VVLDTNVLVSLLIFEDERFDCLKAAWGQQRIQVFSNDAVRQELARVLQYPAFVGRTDPEQVLAFYDGHVLSGDAIAGALPLCRDPDDQKFIALAAGTASFLITDDKQLLRMRRRVPFQIETPLSFQRRFLMNLE
ncbi:MAG TPA: putative toxin-antitoxin system toxin component, PIN family, partial [Burkholderiales bacterium]|nr:putative toxin-antitoxin system toxin component, PIN family [Burkholderiales bacterium]